MAPQHAAVMGDSFKISRAVSVALCVPLESLPAWSCLGPLRSAADDKPVRTSAPSAAISSDALPTGTLPAPSTGASTVARTASTSFCSWPALMGTWPAIHWAGASSAFSGSGGASSCKQHCSFLRAGQVYELHIRRGAF